MDYSFGTWVRRRRKSLDLTQEELAQRVGCSTSLIFKIESDERRPSRQIAALLVEHLEIPAGQRELFLKVARQEKTADHLASLTLPASPGPAGPAGWLEAAGHRPSLPTPVTPILGREHELHAILQQLHHPACRLLTLLGPGGVGKTRLALEAARQLEPSFQHGACFVSLISTASVEFIIPAIADSLGFAFSGTLEAKAQLFGYLREKQLLLVLDNLEHLLSGIQLLDELLERAPQVRILATSREQLNLRAEWAFEVQGLPVPAPLPGKEAEANSAVMLFVQRARHMKLDFQPKAGELAAIAHICQLVEGLPLGLELAAAWIRMMPVHEIAREIERSLDFLSSNARDLPARHRSIRAVFDHSWDLLSGPERRVLMRLSIFRGGFTRAAAERVAGATLPSLSALIDKSIVRPGPGNRYNLHELLRQYAAAQLEQQAGEQSAVLEQYSQYYLAWLEQCEAALRSHRQKEALAELNADIDNLRAAWEMAVVYRRLEQIQRAAFPLWIYYNLRDSLQEGETTFGRAAAMCRAQLEQARPDAAERPLLSGTLGELLSHQAQFTFRRGRVPEAAALYQASLQLLRSHAEPAALTQALTYSGVVHWIAGQFDEAWAALSEAMSRAQSRGDEWAQAQCLNFMGMVAHAQGDYPKAYDFLQDSLTQARALGDARFISFISGQLSRAAQALDRPREALDLLNESLRVSTELGDRLGTASTLQQLAVATRAQGDEREARRLLQESIRQFHEMGDMWFLSHALNLEGYFALESGQDPPARASFQQALRLAFENQSPPNALSALAGLAVLDGNGGETQRALELALFVLAHPAGTQEVRSRAESLRAELEARLTPAQASQARAAAQALTLESLVRDRSNS